MKVSFEAMLVVAAIGAVAPFVIPVVADWFERYARWAGKKMRGEK